MIKLTDFPARAATVKAWITPENEIVALDSWHYQYFRDPETSARYGVPFGKEVPTRLAALRVGFVRLNYDRKGGMLTLESMRFDRLLRKLIDELVLFNADAIDLVRMHLIDGEGQATNVGAASLHNLRRYGRPVNRWTLGSWNNFKKTPLPATAAVKIDDVS